MIDKAVDFAKNVHDGQFRKGGTIPYIFHPLEAANIVSLMTDDEDVICAVLLHDVLEDCAVSYDRLRDLFNVRIADLVAEVSEDKSKTWYDRKSDMIERAKRATKEVKFILLSDKLSNIRDSARDYLLYKDKLWDRFREKRKSMQGWYYKSMLSALESLSDYCCYNEYKKLCYMIFGDE